MKRFHPLWMVGLGRPADPPLTPAQVEANIRNLVWEVAWFGLLVGTTVNFMQVYVVRLAASPLLVSAVTYGPALVSIFWQLPAARWMGRTGHRMRWVLGAGFLHRFTFFLIALVPWFVVQGRAELTVALLIWQAFPLTLAATSFLSMLADAVPADRLSPVVGARMAGFGLASTVGTLLAGRVLQWLPFPTNYQALFLLGSAAAMISQWHLSQVRLPDRPAMSGPKGGWWREVGRMLRYRGFGHYIGAVFVLQLAIGITAPSLPLFWVRRLDASDGEISLVVTTVSALLAFGSLLMRRLGARIGRERALTIGAFGYALYPLLTSVSTTIWWVLPWAALAGLFNAAISVTLFDNLVSVTPNQDRTDYIALYNIAVNVALFAGPLLAGLLANSPGGPTLGLRVAGAVGLVAGGLLAVRRPTADR